MLFDGNLGFAIIPDGETSETAVRLAASEADGAEYLVKTPHITLYHAPLKGAEEELVCYVLLQLAVFKGKRFETLEVRGFDRDWLLWLVRRDSNLATMHMASLLASKHLDREAAARSADSYRYGDSGRELIARYGSPLVMLRFLPHMTLAHDATRGFEGHECGSPLEAGSCRSRIKEVVFAEFGEHGALKRIIASA